MDDMPAFSPGDKSNSRHQLTGVERVAVLLLSIDSSRAARLLKRFDSVELRQITRAVAHLGEVQGPAMEALIEEFLGGFSDTVGLRGGAERAKTLVTDAFSPDQAAEVLSDAFGAGEADLWREVAALSEKVVAQYLSGEHLQIVIYVLSKLDPAYVSRIVPLLPREVRNAALAKMISPVTLAQGPAGLIEEALREDLLKSPSSASTEAECARVANIINNLASPDFETVLSEVKEAYPNEARLISKMIFSFEDMVRLSKRALTIVLDKVPTDLVVLALRGTDGEFRSAVLCTMASRSRRLVENELNAPAAASSRDIAKARKDIVALVLSLAQSNEIELPSSDEPDMASESQ